MMKTKRLHGPLSFTSFPSFITTPTSALLRTIMPFAPGAWHEGAGGFTAMTIVSAFLLKDLVLLVVSIYLLRQDVRRHLKARIHQSHRGSSVAQPYSYAPGSSAD
jgi:uncharacterized membrane protein